MTRRRRHPVGWPGVECEQSKISGKGTYIQKPDTDWLGAASAWAAETIVDRRVRANALRALPVILRYREDGEAIDGKPFASVSRAALAKELGITAPAAGRALAALTDDEFGAAPLTVLHESGGGFGTCYGFSAPEVSMKGRNVSYGRNVPRDRNVSPRNNVPNPDGSGDRDRNVSQGDRNVSPRNNVPSIPSINIIPVGGGGRPTPNAHRRRTEDPQPESSNDDSQAAGAPVPRRIPSRAEYEKLRNKFTEHYDGMTEEEKALYQWGFKFYEQKRSDKPSHAADCLEPTGF
ncbi:MAG: hypothetical protein ACOYA9_12220 [Bilifractor sp.]|jgi:hypothetical protein